MRASYDWIRDYLPDYAGSPEEMAELLTFSGTEVEEVEAAGDDHVLEIGVTSNRVDSLCHVGLAREVSAADGSGLAFPDCTAAHDGGASSEVASLEVLDPDLCPRFTARVIEGIRVGPSSPRLKARIEAIGLRSVNNLVDVTNYVMFELNQPLHAYDLDRLEGAAIVVRRGRKGEKLEAINGTTYEVSEQDCVIADRMRPVGLGGVMGGLYTEVGEGTTRILLESAAFHAPTIRKTARRLQLHSDASFRFERGLDRNGVLRASERAARMILEECGGTLRSGPLDVGGDGREREAITLRVERVERVCGIEVPREEAVAILRRLECDVEDGDVLRVTPPSYRADLTREIDLIEEIMRLHGLHHLPLRSGMPITKVHDHAGRELRETIKDRMVGYGFLETVTPDFVKDGIAGEVAFLVEGDPIRVREPVRAGEGTLRRSLLPSLLEVRKHNQDHGTDDIRIFEVSNVRAVVPSKEGASGATASEAAASEEAVRHTAVSGVLLDGDLRAMRGVLEGVLTHAGLAPALVPVQSPWFDAGGGGELRVEERMVGVLGYPTEQLCKDVGLKVRPVYGELDLEAIRELQGGPRRYRELSRFPSVTRDLAVVIDDSVAYGRLEETVRGDNLSWLEELALFDVYRGKQVGERRKSLAIRLVFRAFDRTLTHHEVDTEVNRLVASLKNQLGAEVRGA